MRDGKNTKPGLKEPQPDTILLSLQLLHLLSSGCSQIAVEALPSITEKTPLPHAQEHPCTKGVSWSITARWIGRRSSSMSPAGAPRCLPGLWGCTQASKRQAAHQNHIVHAPWLFCTRAGLSLFGPEVFQTQLLFVLCLYTGP